MKTNRRKFIKQATAIAGGVVFKDANNLINTDSISGMIKINEPFHGAILNRNHGIEANGGLKIKVRGEAPLGSNVTVNGVLAERAGTQFTADVILADIETSILAKTDGWLGQNNHTVKVLWDKNSFLRYGFEIDDNIFFLREIARNNYKSLFDSFYLKGLKDLNLKYGTKFVLNLFYSDGLEYTDEKEFLLTQFPDKYKSEWKDNSDWLRLTFHAHSNLPDRPYQNASPAALIADFDKISDQIHRFAGEDSFVPPTIVHWGMAPITAFKPLAERGVKVLRGYFQTNSNTGKRDVNFNLDEIRSEYLSRNYALKDFDSGIIFEHVDMICNNTSIDQIIPKLEAVAADPNLSEIIDLMTHEQYFYPFYRAYLPDHFKRLDKALGWVTEHGYKPIFFHDSFSELT